MSEIRVDTIAEKTTANGVSVDGVSLKDGGATLADNLLFNASGKGVYLGVTTATASNLLDDYEEGTWTPVVNSGTATINHRRYTKIGDTVNFWMQITLTGTRTATTFEVSGLPFTADYFEACTGYAQNFSLEGTHQFCPFVRDNYAMIRFNDFGSDILGTELGGGYLNVSGTYRTV